MEDMNYLTVTQCAFGAGYQLSAFSFQLFCFLALTLPVAAADDPQLLKAFQNSNPDVSQVHIISDEALLVAVTGQQGTWERGEMLGVFAHRGDQLVPISIQTNKEFPTQVWVQGQAPDSITLGLADPNYGSLSLNLEIFYDPKTYFPKRIVQFAPVRIRGIRTTAGVLTLTGSDGILEFTVRQRNGAWQVTTAPAPASTTLPPPFQNIAPVTVMPVSSIAEFEKARPDRDRHVPSESPLQVDEKVGPYQREGKRIWVGKTFFDAGGSAGIGDIGYFDEGASSWTFLHIPQMVDWSASALLVEADAIYAGRVRYSDSSPESGGLLRYDRTTQEATVTPLPDVIEKILPFQGRIYCGTTNGFAILDQGAVHRFTILPRLDGSYAVTPVT
jgi:hypothetical protein